MAEAAATASESVHATSQPRVRVPQAAFLATTDAVSLPAVAGTCGAPVGCQRPKAHFGPVPARLGGLGPVLGRSEHPSRCLWRGPPKLGRWGQFQFPTQTVGPWVGRPKCALGRWQLTAHTPEHGAARSAAEGPHGPHAKCRPPSFYFGNAPALKGQAGAKPLA